MHKRTEKVSTTLTPEEKQALRELAAMQGKSMSEYIRETLYERMADDGRPPETVEE